jgi:hypothetical protein
MALLLNGDGEIITPKSAAREMLFDGMQAWMDKEIDSLFPKATEAEMKRVRVMMAKEIGKLNKQWKLGYEGGITADIASGKI